MCREQTTKYRIILQVDPKTYTIFHAPGNILSHSALYNWTVQFMSPRHRFITSTKNRLQTKRPVITIVLRRIAAPITSQSHSRDVPVKRFYHFHSLKQPAVFSPILTSIQFTTRTLRIYLTSIFFYVNNRWYNMLKWNGHVLGMRNNIRPMRIFNWSTERKERRGRPEMT